ncbi:loganic acid O-methyltransferase-like [Quercus robur]|uniref:loganic acid O-methyltransferase-like n=1 Tax=Quercus robur TaxID=38942 RepID=UPI002161531A|nr:loganic acid O-methyltransferase-like [Quercus robur]
MAAEQTGKTSEAYPMKGGDGVRSYANNSSYQRGVIDSAKWLITEAIAEKLDVDNFVSSYTYRIADLGCSVGPNTFFAVQNIIEALQFKHQRQGLHSQLPEFQVFFNDHILNDFNTLFSSLPPNREYYAAGVPGSFHSRLFPNASLHFVFSSYSIHWLSKVPKPVVDKSSPAWNKGRIHYPNSNDEVVKAYQAQYTEDMECFLHARAKEVVCGGLVALIIPGRPNGMRHSQSLTIGVLESCLMDMARKGIISEEKVDSFNLPVYLMSPQELEAAVDRNGYFSIERIITELGTVPETQSQKISSNFQAAFEGVIMAHFGYEILDELFDSFGKKFEVEFMTKPMSGSSSIFFALLKRKATN